MRHAGSGAADALLDVRGLSGWYGAAQILFDVDLQVRRGEVVALMGRNGAGKSTTLKGVMGLLGKRKGSLAFMGRDISRSEPHDVASHGLGFVPEDRRIFTDLTVMENLEVGRQKPREAAPVWTPERLFAIFPNLAEMRTRPGGRMSGGEQQMLTIARTLMGNPLFILLDEPSEGLAPVIVDGIAAALLQLKARGIGLLLSEQNLHLARAVADRAYVIESGQIRWSGTMAALEQDPALAEQYLSV